MGGNERQAAAGRGSKQFSFKLMGKAFVVQVLTCVVQFNA
jgi:hypothetical protein